MKNWPIFLVLLLAVSCSESPTKNNSQDSEEVSSGNWIDEDPALENVQNEDFAPKAQVKYRPSADNFIGLDNDHDSLAKESLARLPEPQLAEVAKGEEPINKILGYCYHREFEQAFKVIDQIYRPYRNHPSYLTAIGTCYYLKGQSKKALLFYNKARDLDPKFAPVYNNMGVLYQQEGKDQKGHQKKEKKMKFKKKAQVYKQRENG
ncbi:MAG: tetratricopeptide repeat protein, partial [Pseudomonadota bacterium]